MGLGGGASAPLELGHLGPAGCLKMSENEGFRGFKQLGWNGVAYVQANFGNPKLVTFLEGDRQCAVFWVHEKPRQTSVAYFLSMGAFQNNTGPQESLLT